VIKGRRTSLRGTTLVASKIEGRLFKVSTTSYFNGLTVLPYWKALPLRWGRNSGVTGTGPPAGSQQPPALLREAESPVIPVIACRNLMKKSLKPRRADIYAIILWSSFFCQQ